MADAAAARDPGATAYGAAGFELAAFADPREPLAAEMAAAGALPPFGFAFLIAAVGEAEEAAQLVIAFPDAATAEAALPVLRARLEAFRRAEDVEARFETAVAEHEGAGLAVVSAVYDRAGPRHPSSRTFGIWRNAVFSRQFTVLTPGP